MAHSRTLLDQAKDTFVEGLGFPTNRTRFIGSGMNDYYKQLTLGMIPILSRRNNWTDRLDNFTHLCNNNPPDIIVFDEFHRSAADSWSDLLKSAKHGNRIVEDSGASGMTPSQLVRQIVREHYESEGCLG